MRPLVRALVLLAALIAGTTVTSASAAAEEILSFDVWIDVLPEGAIEVTETIRVTVEGEQIKRGIIRDFPLEYREEDGRTSLASFDVLGIRRNGRAEPYSQSRNGAYASLRIGDANLFLPVPSEQVYEIRYRTQGQLRALGGYDELYWNVTGNEWAFPIRAASIEIRLPPGTPILRHAAYTGRRGARGGDYEVIAAADGVYRARTTAPLGRGEGFTVAIGWQPGAVTIPPVRYGVAGLGGYPEPLTVAGHRVGPIAAVVATLIGTLVLLAGWLRVGRDPAGGAIYPRFDPPEGLSPAAARYVKRFGFDPRCLTAAIISMAVKGALEIVERPSASLFRDREYRLEPLGWRHRGLSVGELGAYHKLFPDSGSLTLKADKTNGARVDKARSELKSKLWDEHYGASFRRNTLYTLGGTALGIAAGVVLIGSAERWNIVPLLQWGFGALAAGLLIHFAAFLWFEIDDLRRGAGLDWRRLVKLLPFALFAGAVTLQLRGALSLRDVVALAEPVILPAGAAFGAVAGLFHFLMAAPSKAGRALIDQIEGFELYLRTAEEDRLNILNPPEHTPELFERLLPYAVALGVAHQWSAKFADVLAAAAAPSWYIGSRRLDIDSLDRDFGRAVSSTTVPSRGSSGSGGGGSSGGGGGGGGGSGW